MGVVRYLISTGAALGPSYGSAARAREWYREFREAVLLCLVYNIKRLVEP
jgi:IS5 family transposase